MANSPRENRTGGGQAGRSQTAEKRQSNDLRANLADVAHQAGEAAREKIEGVKQSAAEYMEQGREMASEYVDQGREMAQQYLEQGRERAVRLERTLEQQIREQPLRAILTAAGIGFIVGILFSRR